MGFTGIAVAFLGAEQPDRHHLRGHPVGGVGGGSVALQIESEVPREFVIILQGILILSVVIAYEIAETTARGATTPARGRGRSLEDSAAEEDIEGLARRIG